MGKLEIITKSTLCGIGIGLAILGGLSFIMPVNVEKVCFPFVSSFSLICFIASSYFQLIKKS